MPDEIDRITDMTERQMENALQHRARQQASRAPGLTTCEQDDCRAPISAARPSVPRALSWAPACVSSARQTRKPAPRTSPHGGAGDR